MGPPCCPPAAPALAPNYQSAGADFATPGLPDGSGDLACWWSYFNDPTLDLLIQEAQGANLDVRQAYLRVVAARAQRGVVRGDWFPQLDGAGGYTYRKNSTNASQFQFNTPSASGFQVFSLGFDAAWELDLFGKIRNSIEAASAEVFSEREAYRDVMVTLQSDVAREYVALRIVQRRLAIAVENLSAQRQTWEFVRRRLAAGLVGPLDEAQARTNVHATEAEIPDLEEQIQVTLNRLAVLLGSAPGEPMRALVGVGPIPTPAPSLATGIPADLLRRRPDVRQAQFDAIAACARVGVAKAELYPQFSLNGTISVDSRDVATLFTSQSLAFHVGPTFRWNIFGFGRVRNVIALREAQWEESRTAYRQAVLLAVEEVESGLVGFSREQQRMASLREAATAARDAVRLSRAAYESGLVSFQSVLDSERQRLVTERDLAQSEGTVTLNMVRTYKALGGGWQCAGIEAGLRTIGDVERETTSALDGGAASGTLPQEAETLPPSIPTGDESPAAAHKSPAAAHKSPAAAQPLVPELSLPPDGGDAVDAGDAGAAGAAAPRSAGGRSASAASKNSLMPGTRQEGAVPAGPPLLPPPSVFRALNRAAEVASANSVLDGTDSVPR